MNTNEFISGFLNGTIGRKKTHGTFKVLEGQHCELLVHSTRNNGQPTGNEVIAIKFLSSKNSFSWLASSSNRRMSRTIGMFEGVCKTLPASVFNSKIPGLLSSGIVDTSDSYSVIEIGDTPYLFTHGPHNKQWNIKQIEALDSRVSTINEALKLIAIPEGCVIINKTIVAKVMPNDFAPQEIDKESKQLLITPPSPIDFGFAFEECMPTATGMLIPLDANTTNNPRTARELEWSKAKQQYDAAYRLWNSMYPYAYANMNIKRTLFSLSSDTSRAGRFVVSSHGVFFKGIIHSTEFSNTSTTAIGWHKYMSTKRIYKME